MKLYMTILLLILCLLAGSETSIVNADDGVKNDFLLKAGTKIGDTCVNPKDGAEMVWVPAGEFLMGVTDEFIASDEKESGYQHYDRWESEKPQRKVYLDGYWIYKYEVTVAQFRKFCQETNRDMNKIISRVAREYDPARKWVDNSPIVLVNYEDATEYAKWADASLPSEAQWEKAARGVDGRTYPWGNKWDPKKCNCALKYPWGNEDDPKDYKFKATPSSIKPVGSFPDDKSIYGCMDMAGNVSEWCQDLYYSDYYKEAPLRNPVITGKYWGGRSMVFRGGSWEGGMGYAQILLRQSLTWSLGGDDLGFRLVHK